jgi:membrane fusion protein, multidrug efflux system
MSYFRTHRIAAIVVLIGAGAWVGTGHFAAVGSAHGEERAPAEPAADNGGTEPAEVKPLIRTVAAVDPVVADHARTIRISGATEPDKSTVLASRAEGIIDSLVLKKGESVSEGTIILTVEGPETLARLKIAQVMLEQRDRELAVAQRSFDAGNLPETQLTSVRSAREAAAAELTLAEASVDRLQLKAPFSGLVDTVEVEVGEWIQPGAPVAKLLSLDPIVVHAEVSEIDVGNVAVGAKAKVVLVNGETREGTVRFVALEASKETRTFPVEIALPNPENHLPAGMTADVILFAEPVKAVTIPRSVITLSDEGKLGVRVVGADKVAQFAAIEIIDDTPEGLVVTGVPEGVKIIVAGQDLVRNGDVVEVSAPAKVSP